MKILLASYCGMGAWFTLRLQDEGHDVDYWLMDDKWSGILQGIVPVKHSGKSAPDFKKYDLVLFDLTGRELIADKSREVTPTIGDGSIHSLLEDDRLFGIELMEQADINVPFYEVFDDIKDARKFVKETKKTYVFKPFGGQKQETITTYVSKSAEDLLKYLDKLTTDTKGAKFLLQEVVQGTEVSTEGFFDGNEFYFINGTLEEKKFMNDRKGPNTGCSGNLVWVYQGSRKPKIFTQGLGKTKDVLKDLNFRGMIDLNLIVSDSEIYGLEWTPRFGYDASATVYATIKSDLGEFFWGIAAGLGREPEVLDAFAASVRLTIPPYPCEVEGIHAEDVPIEGIKLEQIIRDCYLYDVKLEGKENLVSAGLSGFIACPITVGFTMDEAFHKLQEWIKKIHIPNMQYRTDIHKCTMQRYRTLGLQGWLR